jgi:hypothetical protein
VDSEAKVLATQQGDLDSCMAQCQLEADEVRCPSGGGVAGVPCALLCLHSHAHTHTKHTWDLVSCQTLLPTSFLLPSWMRGLRPGQWLRK